MLAQSGNELHGRRILLLEDERLVAHFLEDALKRAGAVAVETVGRFQPAMNLLAGTLPDAVVLNLDLAGRSTVPIAELLIKRGIPFIFYSGFDPFALPPHLRGIPFVLKPAENAEIVESLRGVLARPKVGKNSADPNQPKP
jgi:two-component SAPR family response regulator